MTPGKPTSRRVVRGTATFIGAAVLQRAAPFLLLPVFARVLSPAEFGQIGVILTLATAVGTILSFGLETAIFRGYLHRKDERAAAGRFVNTVGAFAILVPLTVALIASVVVAPALARAFDVPVSALMVSLVGTAANVAATLVPLALLRAQERLRAYLALTWVQVAVSAGLSILFVAVLRWGVIGWAAASAITAVVLLTRGLIVLGHRWTADIEVGGLISALRFGLPLVPHSFAHWGLAASDRAILGAFVPASIVGAYYVGFLITLPINLLGIALSQATQPLFAEATTSARRRAELGRVATIHALTVILLSAAVALVAPPAAELLLPQAYAEASAFVPWLAAGACLFALYLIPMNAVSVMAGYTKRVWIVTVLAAVLNIGLNLVLVPRMGAIAAAVNTAVGYGVLFIGVVFYLRRLAPGSIPFEPSRIGTGVAVIAAGYLAGSWIRPDGAVLALALRGGLIVAVATVLVTVGPLARDARIAVRALRPSDGVSR